MHVQGCSIGIDLVEEKGIGVVFGLQNVKQMTVGLVAYGRLCVSEDMRFELLGLSGVQLDGDEYGESSHVYLLELGDGGTNVTEIRRRPKHVSMPN